MNVMRYTYTVNLSIETVFIHLNIFSLEFCLCISGFAASVDKESSSEGEKAEDEDEEEEGDEREEAEDRKRRRAKTAKGLRQKTSKSRGEVNLTARI